MALVSLIVNIFLPGIGTIIAGATAETGAASAVVAGIFQFLLWGLLAGWIWALVWSAQLMGKTEKETKTKADVEKQMPNMQQQAPGPIQPQHPPNPTQPPPAAPYSHPPSVPGSPYHPPPSNPYQPPPPASPYQPPPPASPYQPPPPASPYTLPPVPGSAATPPGPYEPQHGAYPEAASMNIDPHGRLVEPSIYPATAPPRE